MNEKNAPASVGTIELSNIGEQFLVEMSPDNINLGNRIGFCSIEVWPDEGPIPHFHIISKNNIKWECCIEIYKPKYFIHGSKQGTLTNKQLKILDTWLRDPYDTNNDIVITRWDALRIFWQGMGNPTINIPKNPKQPDYTKTI